MILGSSIFYVLKGKVVGPGLKEEPSLMQASFRREVQRCQGLVSGSLLGYGVYGLRRV